MNALKRFVHRLEDPSPSLIRSLRDNNIRPEVMMCYYYNNTCLIALDKRWHVWTFPQGGIDEGENARVALERETKEELGNTFFKHIKHPQKYEMIGHGHIPIIPNPMHKDPDKRNLIGKHFFIYAVIMESPCNVIKSDELAGFRWETYHDMLKYIRTVKSNQKRKLLMKVLDIMQNKGYI